MTGGEVVGAVAGGVVAGGVVAGGVVAGGVVAGGVVAGGDVAGVLELDEGFGLMVLGVVVCGTVEAVAGAVAAGLTVTTTDHAPHLSVMFPCT